MKILLDNVNLSSSTGPNSFGRQLTHEFIRGGHTVENLIDAVMSRRPIKDRPDIHLAFIESTIDADVPIVQRLDGIYYNSDAQYGEWWLLNSKIHDTYERACGVIFQSQFSQRLVESFFGAKLDVEVEVIGNGVDLAMIAALPVNASPELDRFDSIWVAASNWRPHKRLGENIRYFLEHSRENDVLVIAGAQTGPHADHERVVYVGELRWDVLIGLYKRAQNFIHLAYHDNCPNVIVDARAAGCHIICASCSGSPSIAGVGATIVEEDDWEPQPIELYKPPMLDFSRTKINDVESNIDIKDVAARYVEFMERFTL